MALFDLNRSNDTPVATLLLAEITPKDYPTLPAVMPSTARTWVRTINYSGGAVGDDVDTATRNEASDDPGGNNAERDAPVGPFTQADKAAAMVPPTTLVVDIARPRGWIAPGQPATPLPAAPTLTSIAPNTVAHGAQPFTVTLTGTGFTSFSQVFVGGMTMPNPAVYVSPTSMTVLVDPRFSVAGSATILVEDHDVRTAPQTLTIT